LEDIWVVTLLTVSVGIVFTESTSSMTVSTGHGSIVFIGILWTWSPTLVKIQVVSISTSGTVVGFWSVTGQTVTVTEFTMLRGGVSVISVWTWVDTFSVV
jgi:hypothetical protein